MVRAPRRDQLHLVDTRDAALHGALTPLVGSPIATQSRSRPLHRGYLLIIATGLVGLVMMIAIGPTARLGVWRALGVPALTPELADLRVITSGWECVRLGHDVLVANPCDPWGRPMNYPRIWTTPATLGIGQEVTEGLGVVMIAIFLITVALALGQKGRFQTAVAGVALVSPSVMLAMERGNSDVLVFIFVTVAISLHRRGPQAASALFLAVVLKLYPVAAIAAIPPRRTRLVLAVLSAAYVLVTMRDIRLIAIATPHSQMSWSYGAITGATSLLPSLPWSVATVVVAALWLASALVLSAWVSPLRVEPVHRRGFVAGACIYLGTYALGPSWDYRLIFLLLTLPYAVDRAWLRQPALLLGVVGTLWLSTSGGSYLWLLDQMAQLLLAVALLATLIAETRAVAAVSARVSWTRAANAACHSRNSR